MKIFNKVRRSNSSNAAAASSSSGSSGGTATTAGGSGSASPPPEMSAGGAGGGAGGRGGSPAGEAGSPGPVRAYSPPEGAGEGAGGGMVGAPASAGSPGAGGAGGGTGSPPMDTTPRADVTLPRRERRRSSLIRNQKMAALKDLPPLKDTQENKREMLFQQKLQLCSVVFNFDDPNSDKRGKELKRQTLLELVDYVNTSNGQKIFTEALMPEIIACVRANVCRALPPQVEDFDPDEDEPALEPAWPHLQVVYEFFLRFIVSPEVNAKVAKRYVDQRLCLQLIDLFDSEDPRERDYLKTILHRIYGKFMSHRSFIRKTISNVFYRFIGETGRHNGIGELLEILGSIINGFAIPLKKEHILFLERALIPLHIPRTVALYHHQLSYCIVQYVEKDVETAVPILQGLIRCWPWSSSAKQVLFLGELEEVLELIGEQQLEQVEDQLFNLLARCVDSQHFQVAERALFLWNNEVLGSDDGLLGHNHGPRVLPYVFGPLLKNSQNHWNSTVEGLAQNVLKKYMEKNMALYDECSRTWMADQEERRHVRERARQSWEQLEAMAATNREALGLQHVDHFPASAEFLPDTIADESFTEGNGGV